MSHLKEVLGPKQEVALQSKAPPGLKQLGGGLMTEEEQVGPSNTC